MRAWWRPWAEPPSAFPPTPPGGASTARRPTSTPCSAVTTWMWSTWVYAPSIVKADRLAAVSSGAILEMRGGECHSGSHSPYSKQWQYTGGGALLRLGVHPLGAMLYLKRQEGVRRNGVPIRPMSVTA